MLEIEGLNLDLVVIQALLQVTITRGRAEETLTIYFISFLVILGINVRNAFKTLNLILGWGPYFAVNLLSLLSRDTILIKDTSFR